MFRASLAAAGAFAALAALVAAGRLTSVDQWSVDHAMPWAHFTGGRPSVADALIPLWNVHWHGTLHVAAELVTLPAAFTPATLLLLLCLRRLRGRGAAFWAAAYLFANAVEELTKSSLTRPALHADGLHLAAFDSSFPSGHTIRSILLAAAIATAWPPLRVVAAAWAACAIATLELAGFHVPSDLLGGGLLAAALLPWLRFRRGSPAAQTDARGTRAS